MMSTKKASLCAYEKVRMETMQSNAEIMKEIGNNTIANILLQKLASVEDDESNIVSEARKVNDVPPKQPNEPPKVSNNVNSSSSKKGKKQLVQTLPMDEFIASQSRDGQSKNSKSQQNQLPLLVKETQQNKALADKKSTTVLQVQFQDIWK